MAQNAAWTQFLGLLNIDGAANSEIGSSARGVQQTLSRYMKLRFGTTDISWLVDIINNPTVVGAVTTSINHTNTDATAITNAVKAVTG